MSTDVMSTSYLRSNENGKWTADQLSFVYGVQRKSSVLFIIHCVSDKRRIDSASIMRSDATLICIFFVALQFKLGPRYLIVEVYRSQSRHTHPLGPPWKSDQLFAEVTTYTKHNKRKRWISSLVAGFKPAIPLVKRQQNYALNEWTTGIGSICK